MYCKKSLDAGENNNYIHNICVDESIKRLYNETCVKCGKNSIDENNDFHCKRCLSSNADFKGYTGP